MVPLHFAAELAARAEKGRPITVGLAGAGQMGTDLVVQLRLIPGMRLGALCTRRPEAARAAAALAGWAEADCLEVSSASAISRTIGRGRLALTDEFDALASATAIDVVIDATGNPDTGAAIALAAIRHGKPIVMLNVEADITIGRHLRRAAERAGVIYSGAAGDEPAATLELIGFAQSLGLEIIAAGKGKNNPLKFDAVPAEYEAEAKARNMNARMLVEFVDGSKTMIEMVALANCTGFVPDIRGMHGPNATRETLADVLIPKADGGILGRKGVVDYSIGKGVAPGVFCVVAGLHPRVTERMIDLKVGKGPYFTLHRPFHLTSLEVPLTAARAVLHGRADMRMLDRPVAEAGAIAKRDLRPGERLGKIGEADYRAVAMSIEDARATRALPVGLAERAEVTAPVAKGDLLTATNAKADPALLITRLRAELDAADEAVLAAAE